MKINLLFSKRNSIGKTLLNGFRKLGHEVDILDLSNEINSNMHKLHNQSFRLPNSLKRVWQKFYRDRIHNHYLSLIDNNPAELFVIYNSQMLTPEIVRHIKDSGSKVVFFLGDSPFYTRTNEFFINILYLADYIFSPDSYWIFQLKMMGIKNIAFLTPGFHPEIFKKVIPTPEELEKYNNNCVFLGLNYDSILGYKRTLFLSKFADFGLKIYGSNNWYRWIKAFPELQNSFQFIDSFISDEQWNLMCNCAKIHPIDANPGLINGIHIRIMDSIGSGILPIAEYRKDMDLVFPNNMLPTIKSYSEVGDTVKDYLNSATLRKEKNQELFEHITKNHNNIQACKSILQCL